MTEETKKRFLFKKIRSIKGKFDKPNKPDKPDDANSLIERIIMLFGLF